MVLNLQSVDFKRQEGWVGVENWKIQAENDRI